MQEVRLDVEWRSGKVELELGAANVVKVRTQPQESMNHLWLYCMQEWRRIMLIVFECFHYSLSPMLRGCFSSAGGSSLAQGKAVSWVSLSVYPLQWNWILPATVINQDRQSHSTCRGSKRNEAQPHSRSGVLPSIGRTLPGLNKA